MTRSRAAPVTDAERRLLAEAGKPLGRSLLAAVASIATPETILRWYRESVAAKFDGSRSRSAPGSQTVRGESVKQLLAMARENATWGYAERFVRSIKHVCLGHVVALGKRHLRSVVREFVEHYHAERTHQGLANVIPFPSGVASPDGRIGRRERLGGLLNFYERRAA